MKAWLITWEWGNDAAAVEDRIAGILNPRLSADRVGRMVEFFYARETSTAAELAHYARSRKNNPYPATKDFNGRITCGHNPYLRARLVKDFTIKKTAEGFEEVSWVELPVYRAADEGPVQVRGDRPQKTVRKKLGALSSDLVWDRSTGGFRGGWSPEGV